MEEIFYRGFMMKWFLKYMPQYGALFLSAILFGFMHLYPSHILSTAIFGIFVGFLYLKTKSVYPCIIVHFIYNLLFTLFRIIYPLTYEEYKIVYTRVDELSLYDGLGIIFFALGVFMFIVFMKKNKTEPAVIEE